jgi:hypothetical protein
VESITVSWVTESAAPDELSAADLLEAIGFTVKRYPPGGNIDGTVDIRLLLTSGFSSRTALRNEILRDPRPALVLSEFFGAAMSSHRGIGNMVISQPATGKFRQLFRHRHG